MVFIKLILIWIIYILGNVDGMIYAFNDTNGMYEFPKLTTFLRMVAIIISIIIINVH